jgi:hypothetical protein
MVPILSLPISSGSKRRNPDIYIYIYIYLSEAKASLRIKFLIISGSRKEPRYILFSLKSPGKRNTSRFPNRAPKEREARSQGTLHISQKPIFQGPQ